VLDLAQLAFHLLSAGIGIEQREWQFFPKGSTWPLEPFSGFSAIAENLGGQSVDSADASKAIRDRRAKARRKDVLALQRPLGNSKDVKQKRPIHRQQSHYLVELPCGKALSDGANLLTCGWRNAWILVRHLSIIIRQMSYAWWAGEKIAGRTRNGAPRN
jgi:hypothetical protein